MKILNTLVLFTSCILSNNSNIDNNITIDDCNFTTTFNIESYGKFNAVNKNDLGQISLGIIQFRGKYAKELMTALKITKNMSIKNIKALLSTNKSKKLQLQMFNKYFVTPIITICNKKGIKDKRIIEFLVDWRVNGMPKWVYKRLNKNITLKKLKQLRKYRYISLHKKNPNKYTKVILKHWLKRVELFYN